ncbi:hypothetical protein [Spirosoma sp.]
MAILHYLNQFHRQQTEALLAESAKQPLMSTEAFIAQAKRIS